jgi:hypothetical protein
MEGTEEAMAGKEVATGDRIKRIKNRLKERNFLKMGIKKHARTEKWQ